MQAAQPAEHAPMTEAEYLAFADSQEFKYEYKYGRVYAMTGGSVRHGVITGNTIGHLLLRLNNNDCSVTSSDVRVYIATKRAYRYPDVTVFCDEPSYLEARTDTITNPTILVEVLSPGTELVDRNEKLNEYTQIESLQAYILIAQDTPKVEMFRRFEGDKWLYEYATGLDSEIHAALSAFEIRISLAEIYRRVRWNEGDDTDEKT